MEYMLSKAKLMLRFSRVRVTSQENGRNLVSSKLSLLFEEGLFRTVNSLGIALAPLPLPIWKGCGVCLTTFPGREVSASLTLRSLRRQLLRPEKIFLSLNEEDYPDRKIGEPLQGEVLRSRAQIIWDSGNIGPFTKLVPALPTLRGSGLSAVTVDDDASYTPSFLWELRRLSQSYPGEICGLRGWSIPSMRDGWVPYIKWEPLDSSSTGRSVAKSPSVFLTGVGGVFYPPHFLKSHYLDDRSQFMKISADNDDIWFWAVARKHHIPSVFRRPRVRPHYRPLPKPPGAKELYPVNRGGGGADRAFFAVRDRFGWVTSEEGPLER